MPTSTFSLDTVSLMRGHRWLVSRELRGHLLVLTCVVMLVINAVLLVLLFSPVRYNSVARSDLEGTLERVLRTRKLRVLCPLDYAPFGLRGAASCTKRAFGADVDAVNALASTLDAEVIIMPTSWAELQRDFETSKADVAIGGITPTLLRRRTAAFSPSYAPGGKVVVARCDSPLLRQSVSREDAHRTLNVPTVHISVNRGGTNEQIARLLFPNASLHLVSTNGEQFEDVARSNAPSLTITDIIEARIQCMRYQGALCMASNHLLTSDSKAFMLPQHDLPWQSYVAAWIQEKWNGFLWSHRPSNRTAASASLHHWIHIFARNLSYCEPRYVHALHQASADLQPQSQYISAGAAIT